LLGIVFDEKSAVAADVADAVVLQQEKEFSMEHSIWAWVGFHAFVFAMLALDLGVFHKDSHDVGIKESLTWSAVWVALALVFAGGVYTFMGQDLGVQFLTGYLVEKTLSVDNIFVIIMVFAAFQIPSKYQHRVLFWGILGALVFRAIFIFAGVALLEKFHWMIYLFGGILIFTGIKMLFPKKEDIDLEKSWTLRIIGSIIPLTKKLHGQKFFTKENGKRVATPLFAALIMVEITDLIFAVDSIPAILAISRDPFIVYTSNVFAILGLRSLFFAVHGIMGFFHYINYGLAAVLVFVGTKMMLVDKFKIDPRLSLVVIIFFIGLSMIASKLFPKAQKS
jgi:tellurite resistance protein TerC